MTTRRLRALALRGSTVAGPKSMLAESFPAVPRSDGAKKNGDGPQGRPRVDLTGLEMLRMHVEDVGRGLREDEIAFVSLESVPDEADSRRARARNRLSDA